MAYKTPGVYVKEISLFPPSVAEVETAIPAFIGYTEKAVKKGEDLTNKPTRIKSLLEFHELFGGAFSVAKVNVTVNDSFAVTKVEPEKRFYMYESLRLFFNNGGGKCYIVSVGDYSKDPKTGFDAQKGGLTKLAKYDEPTMILFPDAPLLTEEAQLYSLQQAALQQCAKLQDRVGVFDLYEGDYDSEVSTAVQNFRDKIGINDLKYGAAYTPWIYSAIPKEVDFNIFSRSVTGSGGKKVNLAGIGSPAQNNLVLATQQAETDIATIKEGIDEVKGTSATLENEHRILAQAVINQAVINKTSYNNYIALIDKLIDKMEKWVNPAISENLANDIATYISTTLVDVKAAVAAVKSDDDKDMAKNKAAVKSISLLFAGAENSLTGLLASIQNAANTRADMAQKLLYEQHAAIGNMVNHIKKELARVPPSGAIAGVYAMVDNARGVWKAPANVSLSSVLGPVEAIDDSDQEDLNIDVNGGKSVNAIRAFAGKGTLVWGARTLAGNDNEWRYIPVRRFYNMVEESVKKSTSWAVFEPNAAPLWVKVKGMIDNYLIQKWRDGALAGATPDDAFFVKIGLGQTMTPQDILEGRLIVEIGMAVVRPAEFIILKFSHKMQES